MRAALPTTRVRWRPSYRVVASRFPPVDLFEGVAGSSADLDALNALEGLTSPRLREQAGAIHLVAPEDRRFGAGYSPIMAAFCYLSPTGSRFADTTYGAYYCAHHESTAIAETRFHAEQFMRESGQPAMMLQKRVYQARLDASLVDLRGLSARADVAACLDPDRYAASQALGRRLRDAAHYGIVYPSVRQAKGECAAIFRPPALGPATQGKHLGYDWDGTRIRQVYELRAMDV